MTGSVNDYWNRFPYVGLAIGLVVMVVVGAMATTSFNDHLKAPGDPKPLAIDKVNQVTGRTWVDLSGGIWNCQSLEQAQDGSSWKTHIALNDSRRSTVVLVTFSGQKACDQLPSNGVTGELYQMTDAMKSTNQSRLAGYPAAASYWALCDYCDPEHTTLLSVIVLFVLAFGGLVIAVISYGKARS